MANFGGLVLGFIEADVAEAHVAHTCADECAQRTVCLEKARRAAMAGPSEVESRGEKPFLGVVPESSEKIAEKQN